MSGAAAPGLEEVRVAMRLADHAVGPPIYATEGAAGADLQAANPEDAPIHLEPGRVIAAPTGVILALPEGVEAQIRPRSGLARRHSVTVANAPGTIDWDYRGEIQVLLINLGAETLEITRGMRIAQLVLAPVLRGVFEPASALDETARGAGGFGSTGFGSTGPDATGPGPGGRG